MCRAKRLLSIFYVHVSALSRGSVAQHCLVVTFRRAEGRGTVTVVGSLFQRFPFSLFSTSPLVIVSFVSVFSSSRSAIVRFPRQSLPPRNFLEERHRRRHLETTN
uniref:Putative secreted protein n=1 Tax=Ixodes ricinus TaxID=34613 RepID=A0A6B0UD80_IXORI